MEVDINSIWKGLWGYDIRDELKKFIESYLSYIDENYYNIQKLLGGNHIKNKEAFIKYVAWVTMGIQFVRAYDKFRNIDSDTKIKLGKELYYSMNYRIWEDDFISKFIKNNKLEFTHQSINLIESFNEIRENYGRIRVEEKILVYFIGVLLSKPSDDIPPEKLSCYNSAYNIYKKGKSGEYELLCMHMLYDELIRLTYRQGYIKDDIYNDILAHKLAHELTPIIKWCIQEYHYRRNIW